MRIVEPAQQRSKSIIVPQLKWAARIAATLVAIPFVVVYWGQAALIGKDAALENVSQAVALWPGLSGRYVRNAFLRWVIAACHPTVYVGFGTVFSKVDAHLDEYVHVGPYCTVGNVHLECRVHVGPGVHLLSGRHAHGRFADQRRIDERALEFKSIRVEANTWIGAGAIVMDNIGSDSTIGAGAVVVHQVPAHTLAVGVPAQAVRQHDSEGAA